jgi:hypothetical protein
MNTRSRTAANKESVVPKVSPQESPHKQHKQHKQQESPQVMDMPTEQLCPCGGGQSCIVDRRWVGDWIHEDTVFTNAGLPIRKNCFSSFTPAQQKKLGIKF